VRIGKIGHASIVVMTEKLSCFVDPVLEEPFSGGTMRLNPRVAIDCEAARRACDVIILSHHHRDHFSVRSLNRLDRTCPVFYPDGDELVRDSLARLGFVDTHAVKIGEKVEIADLEWFPTPSQVGFPEMGMLFRSQEGLTAWNTVDTIFDDRAIALVRDIGAVDLLLAAYMPLFEDFHRAGFDSSPSSTRFAESYGRDIRHVLDIHPRCVVPGSCGFRHALAEWANDHGFPITERQFLDDLLSVDPRIRGMTFPAGSTISLQDDFEIDPDGLPFVERLERDTSYEWRPNRGMPALVDLDPVGHGVDPMRRGLRRFLHGPLLDLVASPEHAVWRSTMARWGVVWRLEIVFPDDSRDVRLLDLRDAPPQWSETATSSPKIQTTVAASGLWGLIRGEYDFFALMYGLMRVSMCLYEVHRGGVQSVGTWEDEPLTRLMAGGSTARAVDRELEQLGF
jgi:hypothetical protein